MKIAIVVDWLVTYSGAEQVLEAMLECYPGADLFAVVNHHTGPGFEFLEGVRVETSFVHKLPGAAKKYRRYLPLMTYAVEQFDLSGYDLIISSSHAVAKGVLVGPDQLHISYVHSPMRYAWDLQHQYIKKNTSSRISRNLMRYFLHKLRIWDVRTANGVDHFIANSNYIARRITKVYRRESTVIYPPVELCEFVESDKEKDCYLICTRLVPYKRVDLAIEAFKQMPDKKLIVIGDGPEMAKLHKLALNCSNVSLLGYQSRQSLLEYMRISKAFIYPAEEDFGIVMVEALSRGLPVIAYRHGGASDIVRDVNASEQPTGVLFGQQTVEGLCEAIKCFDQNESKFDAKVCHESAKQFSKDHFKETFKQYVEQAYQAFKLEHRL